MDNGLNFSNIINKKFINDIFYNIKDDTSCLINNLIEAYRELNAFCSLSRIRSLLSKRNEEKQFIKNLISRLKDYDCILSMEINHYEYHYLSELPVDSFISSLKSLRTFLSERIEFFQGSLKKAKRDINELHKVLLDIKKGVSRKNLKLKFNVKPVSNSGALKKVFDMSENGFKPIETKDTNNSINLFELRDSIKGIQESISGLSKRLMKLEKFIECKNSSEEI